MFVQKYKEMHRLGRESDGSATLYIGAENWPFPIPLVAKNGAWRFDADGGLKEVLFRRIGENEFTAIDACHQLAKPKGAVQPDSPLANLAPKASGESAGSDPVLIHGYYFHDLMAKSKSGKTASGFTFIAYPAEYRSSGVLTFVVTRKGVVYEKDLGPNTPALANAMTVFHKDATWRVAGQ
jgi:hypothetical protein